MTKTRIALITKDKYWLKPKKKPKTERQKLKDKLDKLFSVIIRSKGHCERCGKTEYLNCHHIFSRSNLSVRWNLDNGVCLNAGWHTLQKNSAHKNPIEFINWIKGQRGVEWYENLRIKANQIKKWTIPELKEKVKAFQEMIKQFEED